MTGWHERNAELRRLGSESMALEAQAGITAAIERAQEGQFMPDPNATSEEYWAEHHDAVRGMTRDAYFSVEDEGLRKLLIAAHNRIHAARIQSFEAETTEAIKALGAAEAKAQQSHGLQAGSFVLAGVIAGAIGYGPLGAIIGAPVGYFFARWRSQERASELRSEIDGLTRDLQIAREALDEVVRRPRFFTSDEEATGRRDDSFDMESAYTNLFSKRPSK